MLYVSSTLALLLSCTALSYNHQNQFRAFDGSLPAGGSSRRSFLATTGAAPYSIGLLTSSPKVVSAAEDLIDYKDDELKFSIKVPAGWEKSVQSLPDRRELVLYIKPNSDQKTLVFFAYTPVRADFTSLGSFGSVDEVGEQCSRPDLDFCADCFVLRRWPRRRFFRSLH